jgi:hypothetical protein
MKYITFCKILMLFIVIIIMAASCKSDKTSRSAGKIPDEEDSGVMGRIDHFRKVYHLCPSPAEMLSIIDVSNMPYRGDILNPPGNADNYLDARSQTLNLGIYITDLAYTSLFGRNEETINYLETVQDIAGAIRVSGAINKEMIDRAKENVRNIDSLISISNEAFINMLFLCEKNNRPGTVIMISTGAFVESLYLAINMIEKYDTTNYLILHVAEQKYAIENIMDSSENLPEDPNVLKTIEILKPVLDIYERFEITGGGTTVKKENSNKLIIGGGKKILLSEEEFTRLKEAASLVRNNIISNNI